MGILTVLGRSLRSLGRRSPPSGSLPPGMGSPSQRAASGLAATVLALSALVPGPAQAASSLSAWRVSREGVLELRTSPGAALQAFFEDGSGGRGPREIGRAHV